MSKSQIELPPKLIPVFAKSYRRIRGAHGGRGSGKTFSFALMTAVRAYMAAEAGHKGVILCAREWMNSLKDSSMAEVKGAIESVDWLKDYFDIGQEYIRTKNGKIEYIFTGLNRNLDSLKSKAKILIAWVDEAEGVSSMAWEKLEPTVRTEGSEIWVTWNPELDGSATDKTFRKDIEELEGDSMVVEMNYSDNPWFPAPLDALRRRQQRTLDPSTYAWIWEGAYRQNSEAQVFNGKYRVGEFEIDETFDGPYYGLDFGFAQDPTAGVEMAIKGKTLYIRREAGKRGLDLDDTPSFLIDHIPGMANNVVRADSARPESISYLSRHGMPRIDGVEKGKGSVEDGIEFMRSFDEIVIHPDCEETIREFRLYSYKVDRLTGDVLTIIVDKHNHYIDACFSGDTTVIVNDKEMRFDEIPSQGVVRGLNGENINYFNGGFIRRDSLFVVKLDDGTEVKCTGDHEFLTTEGMVTASKLKGMYLCESKLFQKQSKDLTERSSTYTKGRDISQREGRGCTDMCGSSLMGRLKRASRFITSTMIDITIKYQTLKRNLLEIIGLNTLNSSIEKTLISPESRLKRIRGSAENGTLVKAGKTGTGIITREQKKSFTRELKCSAINAEKVLADLVEKGLDSALIPANLHGVENKELITSKEFVDFAKNRLSQTSTQNLRRVVEVAQISSDTKEKVFCLTTHNNGVFSLANGLVVSNCRYALEPIMKARTSIFDLDIDEDLDLDMLMAQGMD